MALIFWFASGIFSLSMEFILNLQHIVGKKILAVGHPERPQPPLQKSLQKRIDKKSRDPVKRPEAN